VAVDDTQLLAMLGDDDYAVRQAATRRLLLDSSLTQDDIDSLFTKSETPEQRHRLLRIAKHHDIRRLIAIRFKDHAGAASMGLSHAVVQVLVQEEDESETLPRAGVMAALTLPGFPAYATMDPGDVIIEFDGKAVQDNITGALFQREIQTRRAGQTIRLKVVRNGAVQTIQMTLSNSQALGEAYNNNGATLNNPYRDQWTKTREQMLSLIVDEQDVNNDEDSPATEPAP